MKLHKSPDVMHLCNRQRETRELVSLLENATSKLSRSKTLSPVQDTTVFLVAEPLTYYNSVAEFCEVTNKIRFSVTKYISLCNELDLDTILFILAHEIGHLVQHHFLKAGSKDPRVRVSPERFANTFARDIIRTL